MPATDDEREKLGEALYLKVSALQPEEVAGKITGMMLSSLEANEIQSVVDDEPSLREKVDEAFQLLRKGAEQDQISLLQDELRQAEQWADGMQRDWDEKESGWKKEEEQLMKRIASLEGGAKREKAVSETVNEEQIESARKRLSDINDQNVTLEKELRNMKQRVAELETTLEKSRKKIGESQKTAEGAEEKLAQAEKMKVEAEKEEVAVKEELQEAEKWCEDMDTKHKQELADKDTELERVNAALKVASDSAAKSSDSASLDDSERKLKELQTLAESTRRHADESESLAKQAEADAAALEVGTKLDLKQAVGEKSKLQEDLSRLQSEVEKCRSKTGSDKDGLAQKISDAECKAQKAKEERIRIEELIADAQREMNDIRAA